MRMNEEEPFEGVEIDIPFGTVRVGIGGKGFHFEVEREDDEHRRIRRRVRRVLRFYRHLATFVTINLIIFVIDLLASRDDWFVQWVALIWGIILVLHFLNVFALGGLLGPEAERRMIERQLRRKRPSGSDRE